ncbi:MAG: hypothetical protein WD063_05750 [Pirellulales bacterium]
MKTLLILTAMSLAAGAAGCKNCGLCGGGGATSAYRPSCGPACGGGVQAYPAAGTYAAPGAVSTPVLTAPQTVPGQTYPGQTYPGPEVYTPAN